MQKKHWNKKRNSCINLGKHLLEYQERLLDVLWRSGCWRVFGECSWCKAALTVVRTAKEDTVARLFCEDGLHQ